MLTRTIPGTAAKQPARIAHGMVVCLMLIACASQSIGNAPPVVVEECRREIAASGSPEQLPPHGESAADDQGRDPTAIEAARAARAETNGNTLAEWPEEALLYRCLATRGVVLTAEQATVLAEWQARMESTSPDAADWP